MINKISDWLARNGFLNASRSGDKYTVRSMVKKVTQKTRDIALLQAANNEHEEVVKILLNHGADPEIRDDQSFTALLWAAYQGFEDVVQVMLDHGVDPNQKTKNGRTALMWAVKTGHIDTAQCFLNTNQTDLAATDGLGFTALMHAAYSGHHDLVTSLINGGANPNTRANDQTTALMWAADQGHNKVIQALLKAEADPNAVDDKGKNALMWAATQKLGRINKPTEMGKTMAEFTTAEFHQSEGKDFLDLDTVRFLLNAGIDPNAEDKKGETALKKATQAQYNEIVEILRNAGATH